MALASVIVVRLFSTSAWAYTITITDPTANSTVQGTVYVDFHTESIPQPTLHRQAQFMVEQWMITGGTHLWGAPPHDWPDEITWDTTKIPGTQNPLPDGEYTIWPTLGPTIEPPYYPELAGTPITVTTDNNYAVQIISPESGDQFTFDSESPGVCPIVNATASATPSSHNPNIYWTLDDMAGSTECYAPSSRKGASMDLAYSTLPSSNGEFGNKDVTAELQGVGASDTHTVKIFFSRDATNNPGGTDPNWYYYWDQFTGEGNHQYNANLGDHGSYPRGANYFEIGPSAKDQDGSHYVDGYGVDNFASTCLHEKAHMDYWLATWGTEDHSDPDLDQDGDRLKDSEECGLGEGYSPAVGDTNGDGVGDFEDYACTFEDDWVNGSVNNQDWANPGHQYQY